MNDQQQSRADALTIPRDMLNDLIDDVQSFADQVPCREREKAFRADLLARARALAGTPSLQPAAAPIVSAPADERDMKAAYEAYRQSTGCKTMDECAPIPGANYCGEVEWEYGWQFWEAAYVAATARATSATATRAEGAKLLAAVAKAYGYLYHVNDLIEAPIPLYSPAKASYAARRVLREFLTSEQRGMAINEVGREIGCFVDDAERAEAVPALAAEAVAIPEPTDDVLCQCGWEKWSADGSYVDRGTATARYRSVAAFVLEHIAAPQPAQADAPLQLTAGMDRAQFHDKAWALWHEKALGDAKLPKLSIYAIRTLWDVLFDSMPARADAQAEPFPYQKTFNAIAAATSVEGGYVSISVKAFRDAFGDAPAEAIPAGWKPMPPVLTSEMRMAIAKAAAEYMRRTGGNSPDAIYEAAFAAAPQPAQADDELWDQTLQERDQYHDMADKLARAIATHLQIDIGEHSNLNCPWEEALEAIENAAPVRAPAVAGEAVGIVHRPARNGADFSVEWLRSPPGGAKLYTAPPVARGASLTDEQREAVDFAVKWFDQSVLPDTPYSAYSKALRALLNGADQ